LSGAGQENKLMDRWVLLCLLCLWVTTEVANFIFPLRYEAVMVVSSLLGWFDTIGTSAINLEAAGSA
jgi:hypothetical protein